MLEAGTHGVVVSWIAHYVEALTVPVAFWVALGIVLYHTSVRIKLSKKPEEDEMGNREAEEPEPADWQDIHGLGNSGLDALVLLANGLQDTMADLKSERDELLKQIGDALQIAKAKSVRVDPGNEVDTVTWIAPTEQKTLKKAKLIQLGVTQEQIDAATVKTPKKGYVKINRPKEEKQEW